MSTYVRRQSPGDTEWFVHDRFGMFIHFGLYSLPARHEWIKTFEKISEAKYDTYFRHFDPDLYDPKDWARRAKAAGMKYVVLTTKHHEGFCLFDSKYTDYKSTNTPCGRDLAAEYVAAFREAGLKIGFYYSLIDWHHPEFPIDWIHPLRDMENAQAVSEKRDMKIYNEYMRNQVTELMTQYGKIDILWFDFSYPVPCYANLLPNEPAKPWMKGKGAPEWEADKLIETVRRYQPHIIINNRTGLDQDIWTPEQTQPAEWVRHPETGELVTWEACQTFSGAWGYHRDEMTWKSPEMLIHMLIKTVSCGGNLIMNVGPTARGYFDKRACAALEAYGAWMHVNSRSIYGCTMAEPELKVPQGCCYTQSADGKRLYVHLLEYPFRDLVLPNLYGKIEYIQFLHDGSELLLDETGERKENDKSVTITLPVVKPDVIVPVVEIFLK